MNMRTLVVGVGALLAIGSTQAADTLAKIKAAGAATMGVREASGALSYTLGDGKYAGFHVEICQRVPVSYTHLDVYKRQGVCMGSRSEGAPVRMLARPARLQPQANASACVPSGVDPGGGAQRGAASRYTGRRWKPSG